MKRIFSILAAILFTAMVFVSCGEKDDKNPTPPDSQTMAIFMPVPSIYKLNDLKSATEDSLLTDSLFTITEQTFAELPDSMKDELVLYYPFDKGVLADQSVNNFSADLEGSGILNEGNNLINVDHDTALNFDSTFTIAAWINNNGLVSSLSQNIISKWKRVGDDFNNVGFALEYRSDTDNVVMLEFHNVFDVDTNIRASYSLQYNDQNLKFGWHLIVVTFDGKDIKMYVDDAEVCNSLNGIETEPGKTGVFYSGEYESENSDTYGGKLVNNEESVLIGGENSELWLDHYFYGSLDNIMMFNRPLPENEVNALFNLRIE
jgi:hypothetical protein